jgi:hypothetical protein
MSEEKQSIWKSPWVGRRKVITCFVLLASVFFLAFSGMALVAEPALPLSLVFTNALILSVCASLAGISALFFIRWLRSWRNLRRTLLGLAGLATLIAIFYTEENWRGKRAWEECKRELEAQGEVLDWNAYIPPPVPDEQNIFKAPKMQEWFVGRNSSKNPVSSWTQNTNVNSVIVAELTLVPAKVNADPIKADTVLRFDDPDTRAKAKKLIAAAVGPAASGLREFTFVARPFDQIKRVRILVEMDKMPTPKEVTELFPNDIIAPATPWGHYPNRRLLRVESSGSNSFSVSLNLSEFATAADYLVRSDALVQGFNLIREAVRRPQIRMEGDFQRPFEMPIVNFVAIRSLAQEAAQRAQCCLLLGKSEQAFHELSLIIDLRRLLTCKPTTLVEAMIDVAICGLYVETIADGFRLQAWREPELMTIQKQLQQINLPPAVAVAFRSERAAVCQTFQVVSAKDIVERYDFAAGLKKDFWKKITNPVYLLLKFAPRGWTYQNLVTVAKLKQATTIESFNARTQLIDPSKSDSANHEVEKALARSNPFDVLARIAIPNFSRAIQITARNQTMANLGQIVCALERYRFARGNFPETLDALVPQFMGKIPHDIIGGQPLKYRRTDDGKFLLYSIGWNETDDGGQVAHNKDSSADMVNGDWVWGVSLK